MSDGVRPIVRYVCKETLNELNAVMTSTTHTHRHTLTDNRRRATEKANQISHLKWRFIEMAKYIGVKRAERNTGIEECVWVCVCANNTQLLKKRKKKRDGDPDREERKKKVSKDGVRQTAKQKHACR